jgi:type IV pilus assembly protein PilY1|tara:strand:+ start:155 stop:4441 length:4287 start_codon:yes stop_codon:yes gene_type:complete
MRKIFRIIILVLVTLTGNAYSKNLPPGTAESVPANILILLDRTFSMLQPANDTSGTVTGSGTTEMKPPHAVVQDDSGHYFVGESDRQGMSLWEASAPGITPVTNQWHSFRKFKQGKRTSNIFAMEYFNGHVYYLARWEQDLRKKFLWQYDMNVADYISTGTKNVQQEDLGNVPWKFYNRTFWKYAVMDITRNENDGVANGANDGILYFFSHDHFFVRDLKIDIKASSTANKTCGTFSSGLETIANQSFSSKYSGAMAVDNENKYLYFASSKDGKIYSFKLNPTTHCPDPTPQGSWTNPCGPITYGLATDPKNSDILFASGSYSHKVCKMKTNSTRSNIINSETKIIGIENSTNPSTSSDIYFKDPRYLAWDYKNDKLLVTNKERLEITMLSRNLDFERSFGFGGVSRLEGAKIAIQSVVNDSVLTEGANFGFGLWSSRNSGFDDWDTDVNKANPCTKENCLEVKVGDDGAQKINNLLKEPISLYRDTNALGFAKIAEEYLTHSTWSPINGTLDCQNTYVIVIGDGAWGGSITGGGSDPHMKAYWKIKALKRGNGVPGGKSVKTYTVAYGDIDGAAKAKFDHMARGGGTGAAFIANNAAALKSQLTTIISTIITSGLSYTSPAITGRVEADASLYQAQFDYFADKEWQGKLKKTKILAAGGLGSVEWDASEKLKAKGSNNRKIWTVLPGNTSPPSDYNNFKTSNAITINSNLFQGTGNTLTDYHDTSGLAFSESARCNTSPDVADGTLDEAEGLINFIRGKDYFDYDGDCDLTEDREHLLGDIYNSQIALVPAPNADTTYMNEGQEAYWRSINGYDSWSDSHNSRLEVIYAGANSGLLHAFDSSTGEELWGFVPPLIAGKLPTIINPSFNRSAGGGSVPIYGVDGSPVLHDAFFKSPLDTSASWHTILMIPYGKGGAGFSVLDVTYPRSPKHLYSILNDPISENVYHVDHNGRFNNYGYSSTIINTQFFIETNQVIENFETNSSTPNNCNTSLTTTCYKGSTLTTFEDINTSGDVNVYVDGNKVSASISRSGSITTISLGQNITYQADTSLPGVNNSQVNVTVINPISSSGTDYNYRYLAETRSAPRIFRLPNNGAGDSNIGDNIYVAVMGGGYGVNTIGLGSKLFVINLEDGKIIKSIEIDDKAGNGIVNSIPSSPLVITSDTAPNANFTGALVYANDLEGKITKINLTNMKDDGNGNSINLYDKTTLFDVGSTSYNNRYMFHSMDAGIGRTTEELWLFSGTGDYTNLNAINNNIDNLMIGIKDRHFPFYRNVDATSINDLTNCSNTTGDTTGANCPDNSKVGWYINLDPNSPSTGKKVTAEPTVSGGVVYFPIYKPNPVPCRLGSASICAVDDECGTNISADLGTTTESCYKVGSGALSKIIIFGLDLYANIAGEADNVGESETDIVIINAAKSDSTSSRINWRENF